MKSRTHAQQVGAMAWAELERYQIDPTPHAYELWFTYRASGNAELSRRLDDVFTKGGAPTAEIVSSLHNELLAGPGMDINALEHGVNEIQRAAQVLADQVAGGRAANTGFSTVLSRWAGKLSSKPVMGDVVTALSDLTLETSRAIERNNELEEQLAASAKSIAAMQQSLLEVTRDSITDALTGIANRRAFEARLRLSLGEAKSGNARPVSLLILDIDHFKRFNDVHGHQTGDLVLRLVARLLVEQTRIEDTVARYGGEEFAVILPEAELPTAEVVAWRICKALSSKCLINRGSQEPIGQITISVGAAQLRTDDTIDSLVHRADAALYKAKHSGRNTVCVEAKP